MLPLSSTAEYPNLCLHIITYIISMYILYVYTDIYVCVCVGGVAPITVYTLTKKV